MPSKLNSDLETLQVNKDGACKVVPGIHAMTRSGGGGILEALKQISYVDHILCILVNFETKLSHFE